MGQAARGRRDAAFSLIGCRAPIVGPGARVMEADVVGLPRDAVGGSGWLKVGVTDSGAAAARRTCQDGERRRKRSFPTAIEKLLQLPYPVNKCLFAYSHGSETQSLRPRRGYPSALTRGPGRDHRAGDDRAASDRPRPRCAQRRPLWTAWRRQDRVAAAHCDAGRS